MTAARGVRPRNVRSSRPLLLPRFSRRSASRPFAHFGIISVVAVEMGLLTPPFGLSVFAVRSALGVNDVRLETIFAGALPYVGIMLAYPDRTPAGAIIAIMEIWGVNDTMREHAREFAEAGFICLVPDLFWRQEPGVELSDRNPDHVQKAFDLYYEFDYDLGVRDMEDTMGYLRTIPGGNGKVGSVGYCLGGKLCYLMCCRTDIDCAVAYYGTYIEHNIREAKNLRRPFMLHMAMKDRWVQAEVNDLLERRLAPSPLVEIHKYPEADHAFARHGGRTYRQAEADRALDLSVGFFRRYLA